MPSIKEGAYQMTDDHRNEEEQKLNQTLSRIDEIISRDKHWLSMPKEEASLMREAARNMRQIKEQEIMNLKEARPNPYFGRIDFISNKMPDNIETFYFGKYHIPLDYVFNWQAPIGRLFYQPSGGVYDTPSGKVAGTVKLKRELLIEQARLLRITDYSLLPPGTTAATVEEAPLTRELSKYKSDKMGEIVATIQPKQYEEIAANPQRVIIIQGVAGSGKSDVGLHRIAYLLSPHNELKLTISPNRVFFSVQVKYSLNMFQIFYQVWVWIRSNRRRFVIGFEVLCPHASGWNKRIAYLKSF